MSWSNINESIVNIFLIWKWPLSALSCSLSRRNWPINFKDQRLNTIDWQTTFHLPLKMTSTQVVETSISGPPSPGRSTKRAPDTPDFKPVTVGFIYIISSFMEFRSKNSRLISRLASFQLQPVDSLHLMGFGLMRYKYKRHMNLNINLLTVCKIFSCGKPWKQCCLSRLHC